MEIKEALDRLESFRSLKENWDSYGASSISPAAIETAKKLLEGFFVCPVADGTIAITFGDEDVTLIVGDQGDVMGVLN